jgi:hypothetical protein
MASLLLERGGGLSEATLRLDNEPEESRGALTAITPDFALAHAAGAGVSFCRHF